MQLRVVFACLLLVGLASCGRSSTSSGGGQTGPVNIFLYVSDSSSNAISGFRVNPDAGSLTALPGSPFQFIGSIPGRAAVVPGGRLLFVADQRLSSFSEYLLNPVTGNLTPLVTTPIDALPQDLAVDPAANFIYILSSTQVSAFSFDPKLGTIVLVPGSPFPVGGGVSSTSAQRLAIDSTGRFLYVTNLIEIVHFRIGTDGALTLVSRFPQPGAGLTGIAIDPTAPFLYAASSAAGAGEPGGIFAFARNGDGTLTALAGSPFSSGLDLREIAIDNAGKFLAAGGGTVGSGVISFSGINAATGQLTSVPQSPFASPPEPVQLTLDPLGQFLFSANLIPSALSGGNVSGFAVNANTETLTRVPGSPLAVSAPTGLALVRPVQ